MIGKTLSHFKITAKLGEGGMGAVYRAEDTKLGREVAIKVLPEEFTASPERLARFEREARALAALNHPNIAAIYEVGEAETDGAGDTLHFLVMELADGEDLAARISRSSMSIGEALALALQIAVAFEAAHDKGIVHRDLKPSNLMVSPEGEIKVLDFGLAKAWQEDSAAVDSGLTHSPTLTAQMTTDGVILGTAAYMSPEQARGQEADQRSDIWSFGAVLYEMLVGKGLFAEPTLSDTLAAVLRADIVWEELPSETPPAVRRLLRRCLERDAKQRLHSIADARLELLEAATGSAAGLETAAVAATPSRVARLLPAVAVLLALGLIALGVVAWRLAGRTQPVIRSLVSPPEGGAFYLESGRPGPVAVSPDGARLTFTARDAAGTPRLWIRELDDPKPRALPGTEGAQYPFWSPDSQTVAFSDFDKLYRIGIAGGLPRSLCDIPATGGGTWSKQGVIVFGRGPLHHVDASGEGCEPLTVLDPAFPEDVGHRLPRFLPDGQRFLFLTGGRSPGSDGYRIMIGSLDGTPPRELMRNSSQVEMVADHLWFVNHGTLVARPFDPGREQITGEARPIAEGVGELRGPGTGLFSVSESGILAFHGLDSAEKRSITWRDRSGQSLGTLGPPDRYLQAILSADGKRAATVNYEEFGFMSTNLYDVATEISTRFTFEEPSKAWPSWSPSGDRIAVTRLPGKAIEVLPVFSSTNGEILWEAAADEELSLIAHDWSPDGSVLLAHEFSPGEDRQYDIWVLPLDGETGPYRLTETPFDESDPALSPDGRWLAYISDESGQDEVYVTAFPDGGRKWQLSRDGGASPDWGQRGDELFYLDLDKVLMAVPVDLEGGSFVPGNGSALFQTHVARGSFSVTPDGERFLIVEREEKLAPSQINLLVGWQQLLEKRGDQ